LEIALVCFSLGVNQLTVSLIIGKGFLDCLKGKLIPFGRLLREELVGPHASDQLPYRQISSLDVELTPPGMVSGDEMAIPFLSMFSDRFEKENGEMCPFFKVEFL
jgi:hypothetical protein